MRERKIFCFVFGVDQHGVALVESAALRVLAGQSNGVPSSKKRAKRQRFGKAVIDRAFAVAHLRALLEQFHDFRDGRENPAGTRTSASAISASFSAGQPVSTSYSAVEIVRVVGRPVIRQLAQMRSFLQFLALRLLAFVFGANCSDGFCGVDIDAFWRTVSRAADEP